MDTIASSDGVRKVCCSDGYGVRGDSHSVIRQALTYAAAGLGSRRYVGPGFKKHWYLPFLSHFEMVEDDVQPTHLSVEAMAERDAGNRNAGVGTLLNDLGLKDLG